MSPRNARALLGLVLVVAVIAVVVARRTSADDLASVTSISSVDELPVQRASAPAVIATGWLNTAPLDAVSIAGKVVLYDFWTFGCVNCRNTLPWVKAWHARYASDGLVVLSIHTPEFSYEAEPDAVASFVQKNAITYPVALDPDSATWHAFANRYWPAFYLHDRDGRRRLTHFGEGAYAQTEDAIRALLGVAAESPRASVT